MKRALTVLLVVAALLASASACGRAQKVREKVNGYINATEREPRAFEFTEEIRGDKVTVKGTIEDGFRYQEVVALKGSPVLEQVVSDDALSVRVIDAGRLPMFAAGSPLLDSSPILTDSLRAGTWVTDPAGAPPFRKAAPNPEEFQISDPLRDPVEVLQYVKLAIDSARDVKQWREDDIDPAYKRSEDNFPKPAIKEGERRFDLIRPNLPNLNRPGNTPGQVDPSIFHFRKMAIYVRADKVVKVMEEISIDDHPEVKEAVEKKRDRVLTLIKALKAGQTREKVRLRKMSVTFRNIGKDLSISAPQDPLKTSLTSFFSVAPAGTSNVFGFGTNSGAADSGGSTGGPGVPAPAPAEGSPQPADPSQPAPAS